MPASVSYFRKIFGSLSWTAPDWLQQLLLQAKQRPVRFFTAVVLLLAVVVASVAGFRYYQQLPKPLRVMANVSAPELGYYQDDIERPRAAPTTL